MILKPGNLEELSAQIKAASSVEGVDLSALGEMVEYTPEDMTATVQAGLRLSEFQRMLRANRQWLPIDPPNSESITIGDLLAYNFSGPRRYGYGTARDYLIGIRVALGNGEIIKAGGKVVKNVAGYDLCKLFIGAKHTFGIIVEATFKLLPLPGMELHLGAETGSVTEACDLADAVKRTNARPVIIDLCGLNGRWEVMVGLAGAREDVEADAAKLCGIGLKTGASLDAQNTFFADERQVRKISVLPSRAREVLKEMESSPVVCRYGNGIVYWIGQQRNGESRQPTKLMDRVKAAYDPRGIFPKYS